MDGERKPPEFKPIDVIRNQEVTIYQITFEKHSEEYDFYNSTEVVEDFDILKRVINNNLTGSSWHFHRIVYLNVKVIDEERKISI